MRLFLGARMPRLAQLRFAAPLATAQARSARPLGAPSVGTALRLKPRGLRVKRKGEKAARE